ncbi:MAG: polyketide synthase, partial [Bacteroidota bacterium]
MADPRDGIAIVGMAAVFPGAPTLTAFWDNIRDGVDAITDAPAHRWDPVYYDPDSDGAARFYCRRGGFIDDVSTFDPLAYGVMPSAAEGIEPDQLLSLDAAAAALRDAGYPGEVPSPDRTGVVLGRGGYITAGMARVDQYVRTAEQLARSLRQLVPELDEDRIDAVKRSFRDALGPVRADHAIGLVPNLAASRIANRFDFRGPAYTLDAACASSLVAVDQACESLRSGKADLMLAGGVHICHDATFWAVFTQLGALSRAQQIRPFDRRADGLLIGEGVGVLALERLEDAERRGHRVYAVIRGVGVSSDGRGASLMAPRVDGQTLALQRAWAQADLDPTGVGLIEAHGTGTPAGDAAELRTLRTVFGDQGERIPLGSVKSMIGHAMPAAGAAGLIKAALALHHRQRPPTLHCDEPHESLDGSRFWTPVEASPWDGPLVAGVNAFGFGGIDAHVVMEAHDAPTSKRRRARSGASPSPLALFAADTPEALARGIAGEEQPTPGGPCRLALFDPTPKRRAFAATIAARGSRWHGRKDLWVSPEPLLADGGVAFVFPGFEATFEPRIDDVAAHFDLPLAADRQGTDLEQRGTQLLAVSRILDQAL